MPEDSKAEATWKAPYVSWETYDNFFEKKLGSGQVPPQLHPQFLDNYAGSVRPLILSALKATGMIDENHRTQPALRKAVESKEARHEMLREWATTFYAEQLAMAERNETAQALWDSFGRHGYTGSTLRKAVVFYLSLVEALGLPTSPYFKAPKAQVPPKVGGSRTRNGRSGNGSKPEPTPDPEVAPPVDAPSGGGEEVLIKLGEAGSVRIDVNVRWLSLPEDTFTKLRKGIRDLEALAVQTTAPPSAGADDDADEGDLP